LNFYKIDLYLLVYEGASNQSRMNLEGGNGGGLPPLPPPPSNFKKLVIFFEKIEFFFW
jgi:hypothetical protein